MIKAKTVQLLVLKIAEGQEISEPTSVERKFRQVCPLLPSFQFYQVHRVKPSEEEETGLGRHYSHACKKTCIAKCVDRCSTQQRAELCEEIKGKTKSWK